MTRRAHRPAPERGSPRTRPLSSNGTRTAIPSALPVRGSSCNVALSAGHECRDQRPHLSGAQCRVVSGILGQCGAMTRIVIAGGGLSGLSLAAHLAVADHRHPVVVVDDARRPLGDMTWASWSDRPGAGRGGIAVVRAHSGARQRPDGRIASGAISLPRCAWRGSACSRAPVHRSVETLHVHRGHVDRVEDDGVIVDGQHMRAMWVFDSVVGPAEQPPADAELSFPGMARAQRASGVRRGDTDVVRLPHAASARCEFRVRAAGRCPPRAGRATSFGALGAPQDGHTTRSARGVPRRGRGYGWSRGRTRRARRSAAAVGAAASKEWQRADHRCGGRDVEGLDGIRLPADPA